MLDSLDSFTFNSLNFKSVSTVLFSISCVVLATGEFSFFPIEHEIQQEIITMHTPILIDFSLLSGISYRYLSAILLKN